MLDHFFVPNLIRDYNHQWVCIKSLTMEVETSFTNESNKQTFDFLGLNKYFSWPTGCPKKSYLLAHFCISEFGRGFFRGKK